LTEKYIASLVLFATFCYFGAFHLVRLGLNDTETLFFDFSLSLVFSFQHSIMVRKSFRRYLSRSVQQAYVSSVYAIFSGIVLCAVIILWQETSGAVTAAQGAFRLALRAIFVASIVGFYWGTRALGFFEPFGVREILNHLRGRKPKEMPIDHKGSLPLCAPSPLFFRYHHDVVIP
jgi:hypothetical protein